MLQTPHPEEEHVFNDDLLTHKGDSTFARKRFPRIRHVLDHAALRTEFAKYEKAANKARTQVRLLGFVAVAASTLALVALVTRPLWPYTSWMRWPAAVIEFAGMLAAIIAIGGLWLGAWKHRWLTNRLMTERLRQWHFQLVVRRGEEIEASCKGEDAVAAFQKVRDQWLAHFLKGYQGHLDSQLESAISGPIDKMAWLHDLSSPYDDYTDTLHDIFDAYELLRFDHQYGYALYKLESTTNKPFWQFLKWPPSVQRAALSGISSSCFLGALILSMLLICGDLFAFPDRIEMYLRTAAIVLAIFGTALRTIQEYSGIFRKVSVLKERSSVIANTARNFHARMTASSTLPTTGSACG